MFSRSQIWQALELEKSTYKAIVVENTQTVN